MALFGLIKEEPKQPKPAPAGLSVSKGPENRQATLQRVMAESSIHETPVVPTSMRAPTEPVKSKGGGEISLTQALAKAKSNLAAETQPPQIETPVTETVQPVAEKIVAPELEPKTVSPEKQVEKTATVEEKEDFTGRQYIETFLVELNKYLQAGKELDGLMAAQTEAKKVSEEKNQEIKSLSENGDKIKEAIQTFLEAQNEEQQTKDLMSVIAQFDIYKANFNAKIEEAKKAGLQVSNVNLLNINAKKTEINKLTTQIGGAENVKKIIDYVRTAEKVAKRYYEKNKSSDEGNTETVSAVLKFVKNDLPVAKAMAERGDMLSILQAMFAPETKK